MPENQTNLIVDDPPPGGEGAGNGGFNCSSIIWIGALFLPCEPNKCFIKCCTICSTRGAENMLR